MEKSIYDLQLHERLYLSQEKAHVVRVASGWLYKYYSKEWDPNIRAQKTVCDQIVFVPFDNTFREAPKQKN